LVVATVRFVAFARAALRALPCAVATFLFCAFDCFLRLAMIAPGLVRAVHRINARSKDIRLTILRVLRIADGFAV